MDTKTLWIVIIGIFLFISIIILFIISFLLFFNKKKIENKEKELNKIKQIKTNEYIQYITKKEQQEIDNYFKKYFYQSQLENINLIKERKEVMLMQIIESLTFFNEWRNKVVTSIKPENLDMIPRLIGKDGINKRYIENELNILMVIEKNANKTISISSHSSYRKEIAKRVIEKLLSSSTIDKNRIQKYKEDLTKEFDNELSEIGKKAFDILNVKMNYSPKIFYYIGLLQYRTSFHQNILSHSLEVAMIAERIAKAIGINSDQAKLCAFFHDIGKSIDTINSDGLDHVEQGIKIAKECLLDEKIIHSIEAHHNKVVTKDIYASITILADKISGSMPNARLNSDFLLFERCSNIEKLCSEVNGVKKSYAIKSGTEIRIILDDFSGDIKERFELIASEVKSKLLNSYPNYSNIDVVIIANFEYKQKIT